MLQIIIGVIIIVFIFAASRKARSALMHATVWRFITMFLLTVVMLAILTFVVIALWYWWTVIRLQSPPTRWQDTTLQIDEHPDTPGAGGPKKPTIVQ